MASLPALISNLISVTIENRHTVTNCNGSIQFFSGNDYKMESPVNPKQVLKLNQQYSTYQSSPSNQRGGNDIYNDEDDDNI